VTAHGTHLETRGTLLDEMIEMPLPKERP